MQFKQHFKPSCLQNKRCTCSGFDPTHFLLHLGLHLGWHPKPKNATKNIDFIEQLILIVVAYSLTAILIAIPFYLSNYQVTFLNSIFESVSGLTGTGFSIFKNIKYLDPTLILWRSSSQWIGGLFFLFILIIIFSDKSFNFKMTNLTFSGESNCNDFFRFVNLS